MGPLIVILIYLAVVTYIGSVAVRRGKNNTEDFFLAGRSIGPMVFFLSLFATNMTAFAILGSSGAAYKQGVGIFGMMASSSGFMIPLTIFLIGTRLWALGKRFGHMTQVAFFRDRWECSGIGTFIFALSAAMIVPYMIISIIGGGTVLEEMSKGLVPYWLGCLLVTLVVTLTVFLGGMRGTVWVNVFQTILFMLFGTLALLVISSNLPDGGFGAVLSKLGASPKGFLLSREKMPAEVFWSYSLIPLSSIMFPHMSIMCLSAKKMSAFKNTVVAYPLAIMAVWLPSVFLGIIGAGVFPTLKGTETDGVLLKLLTEYAPVWVSGILGAGIISVVMGSDAHQVLALSTMFTKDIFDYYGGRQKFGEKSSILFARGFIVVLTVVAYLIALAKPQSIFELAVRFAFTGFAALAPVMVAALFWKRSTKWGALAATLWVTFWLFLTGYLTTISEPIGQELAKAQAAAQGGKKPGGKPGAGPVEGGKPAGAPEVQASPAAPASPGVEPTPAAAPASPSIEPTPPAPTEKPAGAPEAGKPGPGGKPGGKKPVTAKPIFPELGGLFMRSAAQVTVYGYLPVVPMVVGSALLMILFSLATKPPSKETIEKYFPGKAEK
ncbi:sodium:solute symporter family protein [Armatimonas rosea]|uniref:SSS family solute:Na+ symporter n=1 Tax=Armatimonas rosea TaxID=685828 RepID=A0A7W9SQ92_ARMRO|nr:sodium:solute symporter family protein [Armatimonas rosea]MBB6050023.1 SSS family solute:Na+ symporter [Armatimonas rosea]